MGPRRQRHATRPTPARRPTTSHSLHHRRRPSRSACGSPTTAARPATTTSPVTVNSGGVSNYSDAVLGTPGLVHYWRLGETRGTTFADSVGTSPATDQRRRRPSASPGGVADDPDTAAPLRRRQRRRRAPRSTSPAPTQITVEFWLKWTPTPTTTAWRWSSRHNFNDNAGGFLIDPNAPQLGGTFGVGIGSGASRNTAFFARPTAGAWHHYAFVLDTSGAGRAADHPLRRRPSRSPTPSSTAAPAPAPSPTRRSTSCRAPASGLFGAGDLDEVAIYDRALSAAHDRRALRQRRHQPPPEARFTATPTRSEARRDGHLQRLGLERSRRLDRQVRMGPRRQRHLRDQHRHRRRRRRKTYATDGPVDVSLRVTDNQTGTDTATHTVTVARQPGSDRLLHGHAEPGRASARPTQLRRLRLQRPRRHDRQIRMGPRRQRHLRDRHRRRRRPPRHAYAATRHDVNVGLRVTDNGGTTVDGRRCPVTRQLAAASATTATPCSTPPGLRRLLAPGRDHRPDASPTATAPARPRPRRRRPSASPAASPATPTRRSASTASTTPPAPRRPLRHNQRSRSSSG